MSLPGLAGILAGVAAAASGGGGLPPQSPDAGVVAAVHATVASGTPTIVSQKNVASISKPASNIYRINFTSTLANANYVTLCTIRYPDNVTVTNDVSPSRNTTGGVNTYSTSAVDIEVGGSIAKISIVCIDPGALTSSKYLAAAMWTMSGTTPTLQRQKNVASATRLSAGIHRVTFTSALADGDYSMLLGARFPDAALAGLCIAFNSNNTGNTSLHGTASAVAGMGQVPSSSTQFEVALGGAVFVHADDPPPGVLASASITVSGTTITSSRTANCSVARMTTGIYRLTFASPLPNADYAVIMGAKAPDSSSGQQKCVGAPDTNTNLGYGSYSTTQLDINVNDTFASTIEPQRLEVFVVDPSAM